jgi:membrane protein DedA with SNARE-associated domain
MNPVEQFLAAYGLLALVPLAAVEGDLSLLLAGALSHRGVLWLPAVIGVGALGTLMGDLGWFFLGRRLRDSVRQSAVYRRVGPRIEQLADRLGVWQLITARFIWGTRNASMFFWGQQGLPVTRFLLVDGLSCLLGATVFGTAGYVVGQGAFTLLGHIRQLEHWLLIIVVLAIVVSFGIHRLMRRGVRDQGSKDATVT